MWTKYWFQVLSASSAASLKLRPEDNTVAGRERCIRTVRSLTHSIGIGWLGSAVSNSRTKAWVFAPANARITTKRENLVANFILKERAWKLIHFSLSTSRSLAVGSNFPRLNFRQQSRHAIARLIRRTRGNSLPQREQR